MEAAAMSLRSSSWIGASGKAGEGGGGRRCNVGLARIADRRMEQRKGLHAVGFRDSRKMGYVDLKISCCCNKRPTEDVITEVMQCPFEIETGSETTLSSFDEALALKRKAEDVLPYLDDRCIYLVGMMGSGKTTVGKIMAEALGYAFFDSDKLVEQAVGISSVAQIFKERSEAFFRDNESQVLKDLSSMHRLVVATGGGAVIRPINWKYMKNGITVWLDVPLEALARRIAAVGTASRPLLDNEQGDPYTKAFMKLTTLSEKRGKAYANADARVSLENMADRKGHDDVCALSPMNIAIEALVNIESHLLDETTVMDSQYI